MKILPSTTITIDNVSKRYFNNHGIKNISATFSEGKLNLLVGKNGSGKSTLIKCIMGLLSYNGRIIKKKYKIGYAPEEYVMPESLLVIDFLQAIGRIKSADEYLLAEACKTYLDLFNLSNYQYKLIKTLSNGMKQKLNLLQALIHNPKIIILDEPLAALDSETRKLFTRLITAEAQKKLVIISTHHPENFKTKNKRIYRIEAGTIADDGIS